METLVICLLICLCLYFLLNLCKFLNNVWLTPIRIQSAMRSQGIKGPPYRFLHGNTKEITDMRNATFSTPMELSDHFVLSRIQPHVHSWNKLYGMNFLNWYGTRPQLVVTEPEWVKEILHNKVGAYPKSVIQDYVEKFLGDGLLVSQGEKWLKMRKLANHAFHSENLKGMIPAMIASVESMLKRWKQNEWKEIEVFQEFKILTSEIISRTAFGSSYLEGQQTFDMLTRLAQIVARNNYKVKIPGIKKLLKSPDDVESDKLQQGICDSIVKMMKKREEEAMASKSEDYGSDFLGLLLRAHHDKDVTNRISVDNVIDECKNFYIAGHETTTSALTWIVLLLAIHTDWQDRARQEVIELFGEQNPSPDGIGRLKIVNMIINESLRLYCPVFNITREVKRDVRLERVILPEKMAISLSVLALHHNQAIWGDDVHLFKPDRFADGVAKATNNKASSFLPFGLGPRSCVGVNFASAEMKIAISMILQRYKFTLSPTYVHSPVHILTVCPQYGLQIILQAM